MPRPLTPDDPWLTLQQLSRYSGLSVATLRRQLRNPERPLPHRRVGRRILVRLSAFNRWLDGNRGAGVLALALSLGRCVP